MTYSIVRKWLKIAAAVFALYAAYQLYLSYNRMMPPPFWEPKPTPVNRLAGCDFKTYSYETVEFIDPSINDAKPKGIAGLPGEGQAEWASDGPSNYFVQRGLENHVRTIVPLLLRVVAPLGTVSRVKPQDNPDILFSLYQLSEPFEPLRENIKRFEANAPKLTDHLILASPWLRLALSKSRPCRLQVDLIFNVRQMMADQAYLHGAALARDGIVVAPGAVLETLRQVLPFAVFRPADERWFVDHRRTYPSFWRNLVDSLTRRFGLHLDDSDESWNFSPFRSDSSRLSELSAKVQADLVHNLFYEFLQLSTEQTEIANIEEALRSLSKLKLDIVPYLSADHLEIGPGLNATNIRTTPATIATGWLR
jgi:hypothetical protein